MELFVYCGDFEDCRQSDGATDDTLDLVIKEWKFFLKEHREARRLKNFGDSIHF